MSRLLAFFLVIFTGCFTRQDCYEAQVRHYDDIDRRGGILESCPPDKEIAIVHFEGPPGVVTECLAVDYTHSMPDCTALDAARTNETDAAICRALRAFPEQIELLGRHPRVDAVGTGADWRVRFVTAEGTTRQRGILIILGDDSRRRPVAILY